jgi:hypothetical protein
MHNAWRREASQGDLARELAYLQVSRSVGLSVSDREAAALTG